MTETYAYTPPTNRILCDTFEEVCEQARAAGAEVINSDTKSKFSLERKDEDRNKFWIGQRFGDTFWYTDYDKHVAKVRERNAAKAAG